MNADSKQSSGTVVVEQGERPLQVFLPIENAIELLPAELAQVAQIRSDALALRIDGLEDREGFDKVHEARMVAKRLRVGVEKRRKELKRDALEFGRRLDGAAKELKAPLEEAEAHLQAQEDAYNAERERIKREEAERKAAALQARVDALRAVDSVTPLGVVESLSDEEFEQTLADATAIYEEQRAKREAEAARLAEEQRKAEEARAAEAARVAKEREELEAERAKLAAEKAELDLIKAEQEAQARAEREAAEAAERKAREEQVAAKRREREQAAIERSKPDRDRMESLAASMPELLPEGLSPVAKQITLGILERCAADLRESAQRLAHPQA